jgi:ribosome biogenesis GTPase
MDKRCTRRGDQRIQGSSERWPRKVEIAPLVRGCEASIRTVTMSRTLREGVTLEELGWSEGLAASVSIPEGTNPARVASVYSARVDVWTSDGPRLASLRSRALRDEAPEGGIAVGDWVLVRQGAASQEAVVESVLPRRSALLRQAAGERVEPQAIAANIDRIFIITSADADFNERRLERYLVAAKASGAESEIVLSKCDGEADVPTSLARARALAAAFATSARTGLGMSELLRRIPRGQTVAFVGSSGVGKSALVNRLLGRDVQREGAVRAYDGRGRHTTTRREMFLLDGGGLVIDTPGMREMKPWLVDDASSLDAFEDVVQLAQGCRYRDCSHGAEPGCAVRETLAKGGLDAARLDGWRKLMQEQGATSRRPRARDR